ncbi:hypothetical protein MMC34_005375 [Xylographa carneopallida]|nr:hypothetical protein [Xylographa carneopallida]
MYQLILRPFPCLSRHGSPIRFLSTTTSTLGKARPALPPRPTVLEDTLTEAFLRGSGPGGQKINKTSSAVQLKHIPSGIVVKSQATRSQSQNRKIARMMLAQKLEFLEKGPESRVALKGERARKKKASSGKKTRRKYRALEEKMGGGREETAKKEVRREEEEADSALGGRS